MVAVPPFRLEIVPPDPVAMLLRITWSDGKPESDSMLKLAGLLIAVLLKKLMRPGWWLA